MAKQLPTQIWDLWYPHAASAGLAFARGRMEPTNVLWVHAPPRSLSVCVLDANGTVLSQGKDLEQTADRPMARLTRKGAEVTREDLWPTNQDLGQFVILPGGEIGTLQSWWNAEDGSEWRWTVEFYNHR